MKEYDSNIKIFAFSEFRRVDYPSKSIDINTRTDGYVNLYIDGKSADYVHDVFQSEEQAIDFLQQNEKLIYNNLKTALMEELDYSTQEIGLFSISLLDQIKDDHAHVGYTFLNAKKEMAELVMHKEKVIKVKKVSV